MCHGPCAASPAPPGPLSGKALEGPGTSGAGILKTILIVALVTIVTSLLVRIARRPAALAQSTGSHVLRYSWPFRSIGWIGVIAAVGVSILATLSKAKTQGDWVAVFGMVIGFAALGGGLINEGRAQIRLSPSGLHALSPWRGQVEIPWNAVREVRYSKLSQWFVILGDSGQVVRAHNYLVGLPTLLTYFHEQLDPRVFSKAEHDYRANV